MAFGIDDIIGNGLGLVRGAMERIWPTPEQKASAEAMELRASVDAAVGIMTAQSAAVLAEIRSGSWLAQSWRPITMLTFTALIVARWMGFSAPNISEAEMIELWVIVKYGLGGYVGGRTVEKVAPVIADTVKSWKNPDGR